MLDFYNVRWEYEPRSFPIQWDDEGRPTKSFTPDFYLPDEDVFVELTTMKQSLVTKKKRKVRLFRARYPDVDIRLLYRRDYLHLVFKYGLDSAPPSGSELVPTRLAGPPLVTRLTERARSTSG